MAEAGPRSLDVTVVLLEGGYASTAVAAIEVFYSAGVLWNRLLRTPAHPFFHVRTASIEGQPVNSACALGLVPQHAIAEIENTDLIILAAPGLDAVEEPERKAQLLEWLRAQHSRGTLIAGICSGVGYMAESGLLDGRRATTHWALAEAIARDSRGSCGNPISSLRTTAGCFAAVACMRPWT
jgi:transcriptional regulator GlxA family with amidase domain